MCATYFRMSKNVPPTAKVIWRRNPDLQSHPTDWKRSESNLQPLLRHKHRDKLVSVRTNSRSHLFVVNQRTIVSLVQINCLISQSLVMSTSRTAAPCTKKKKKKKKKKPKNISADQLHSLNGNPHRHVHPFSH